MPDGALEVLRQYAEKRDALLFGSMTIDAPHGLGPQIQAHIDGRHEIADAQGADHIANPILVAWPVLAAFRVVVVPVYRFEMASILVFLA